MEAKTKILVVDYEVKICRNVEKILAKDDYDVSYASSADEALEKMAAGIPLKRLGKPEEIAHTALYIFENDYFTGRVIEMDGGIRI